MRFAITKMKSFKNTLRHFALIGMIIVTSIIPIPIVFYKKDNAPKYVVEQIDHRKQENEYQDSKEIF
ncbi:hypothetical protein GCM10022395_16730 [Snuella lapsa]|uniref:Uncharacterized protein n=2 Tax=Snuella lapsa TaxID=870481 RepID=A0ABP6XIE2_9FLAO